MSEFISLFWQSFPYIAAVAILPALIHLFYFILSPPDTIFLAVIGAIFGTLLVFIGTCLWLLLIPVGWHYFQGALKPIIFSPAIGFIFAIVAVVLYRLRGKHPVIYGVMEVYAGLATLAVASQNAASELDTRVIALLGATYVVIRGLDNVSRGLSQSSRELWEMPFPVKKV